jgi:hypothetical protein
MHIKSKLAYIRISHILTELPDAINKLEPGLFISMSLIRLSLLENSLCAALLVDLTNRLNMSPSIEIPEALNILFKNLALMNTFVKKC